MSATHITVPGLHDALPGLGDSAPALLRAHGVTKTYQVGDVAVPALRDFDLVVRPGEMVAVMGPSGSGKTTLLNCLSGLDDVNAGTVEVGGRDLFSMSDRERSAHRARAMGFVFQAFNLIPVFTAVENVELPLLLAGDRARDARARAAEMLMRVGLAARVNHRPSEMSGGEQQRVTIARALAGRPAIVWADEPTGNLDSAMAESVMDLLVQTNVDEGQTIVLVTHDHAIGDRVPRLITMRDGRLVTDTRRPGVVASTLSVVRAMYPELVWPLTLASAVALASLMYVAVRRPVTRRLALEQFARRRHEAVLAVAGASLGTAIIIASLVVGDTLGFSVRQDAYRVLGPIDERVATGNSSTTQQIELRLFSLRVSPDVDGVVSAAYAQAAVTAGAGHTRTAEPRAVIWNLDFSAAAAFGSAGGPSGISGPSPTGDSAVVNQPLAQSLGVGVGDAITVHLGSRSPRVLITRDLPERGLAGAGPSNLNRSVYISPEVFAMVPPPSVQGVTFVSNEGGVESGAALTDSVVNEIHTVLGPLSKQVLVDTPKRDVLQAADRTAASLGAVFLMIGSFSIIAGALLLVNIS